MKSNNSQFEFYISIVGGYAKMPKIFKDYYNRTFIEGRPGSKYYMIIKNNTPKRVLAVLSVDGTNVINNNQDWTRGFILTPDLQIEITGRYQESPFQKTDLQFSKVDNQYNGVIGCMFFEEDDLKRNDGVFTGFKTKDNAKFNFKNKNSPVWTSTIYYDDMKGLERRGVTGTPRYTTLEAFPNFKNYE